MKNFIDGVTSSGRQYRRLELTLADEIYCAHAALVYEYGDNHIVSQIVAKRIAKIALGVNCESPLVLRGRYATDVWARMDEMAHDSHDGFSELADVAIGDEWAASDYQHMPKLPQVA